VLGLWLCLLLGEKGVAAVAVSPDGRNVLTASAMPGFECDTQTPRRGLGAVQIWDLETGKLTRTIDENESRGYAARFTAHGKRVIASRGGEVRVWSAESGAMLASLGTPCLAMAVSRDGKRVAIGDEKRVEIRDAATLELLKTLAEQPAFALAFGRDPDLLVVGWGTGTFGEGRGGVAFWSVSSGRRR
jgi:WD40 repeat protein